MSRKDGRFFVHVFERHDVFFMFQKVENIFSCGLFVLFSYLQTDVLGR